MSSNNSIMLPDAPPRDALPATVGPHYFESESPPPDDASAVSILSILRRRWLTMLLVTLVTGAAAAAAVFHLFHPKFKVSAIVHVAPVVRPILFSDAETDISRQYEVYVSTESEAMVGPYVIAEILNRPEVASLQTIRQATDPARFIKQRVDVDRVGHTQLLEVSMTGENPGELAVIVNELLDTYLRWREDEKRKWDEKILRSLRREEAELRGRLEIKNRELRERAVESGLSTAVGDENAISAWAAELQQMLSEAKRDQAIAEAKMAALLNTEDPEELVRQNPMEYERFRQADAQWNQLRQRLEAFETAARDDARLGRGPEHPQVRGRDKQIEAVEQTLADREARLREWFAQAKRREFQAHVLSAQATVKVLNEELDGLNQQRGDASRRVFVLEDVTHERERLEQSLARVRDKIWTVEVEQNRMSHVTVDSPAHAPEEPNIDKRPKYLLAGALFALFLGAVAALVRDRLDTSVRAPLEVSARLGLPLLGAVQRVPRVRGNGLVRDERVLEPVRGISTAMLTASYGHQKNRWLVTSPSARSGKSSMVVNLARTLVSTERRVLVVDADNIAQGVTGALGLAGRPGLREFLDGACDADEALCAPEGEDFHLLPAGRRDPQFGAALTRQNAQQRLRQLFDRYDAVIVDSPPVMACSHAMILATLVDEVVLVLHAGKSTREEAMVARRQLATVGSKLVGVILNAVDRRDAPYAYYGYG